MRPCCSIDAIGNITTASSLANFLNSCAFQDLSQDMRDAMLLKGIMKIPTSEYLVNHIYSRKELKKAAAKADYFQFFKKVTSTPALP